MQDKDGQQISLKGFSIENKHRLISAFVWLIEQDKKQNPAPYQRNNKENDRHSMPSNT